jgi:hypothetical protein
MEGEIIPRDSKTYLAEDSIHDQARVERGTPVGKGRWLREDRFNQAPLFVS